MSARRPPSFWVSVSQWAVTPLILPFLVIILRDEIVHPEWLVRLLYAVRLTSDERRVAESARQAAIRHGARPRIDTATSTGEG